MDFNKAKTSKIFFKYIIPQIIGLFFNSIYFIVDGIFIGNRLGSEVLAAVGVAVPLVSFTYAISMLIAIGAGVRISIFKGQGKPEKAREIFNIINLFTLGFSLAYMLFGLLFLEQISKILGANSETIKDVMTYLKFYIMFSPFYIFSFVLSTFVRNDDNPNIAMWSLTVGAVANIVLDYILMYPLNMGLAGAALATGLGPVFSVLIVFPHFTRKKGILFFEKTKFDFKVIKRALFEGIPGFISEFSLGFVTFLYNIAIIKHGIGNHGLAIYLVLGYAILIVINFYIGSGQGIQPAISYLDGYGNHKRIKQLFISAIKFNVISAFIMYISLYFMGDYFYGLFIKDSSSLLLDTIYAGKIYFINLPFTSINMAIIAFLQSLSKVKEAMFLSLVRNTLPLICFLFILPKFFDITGLWMAITCAEILSLVVSGFVWSKEWKRLSN